MSARGNVPARRRASDRVADTLADDYFAALRAGDPAGAEAVVLRALEAGLDPGAIHSGVIAPAMHRIGDLWERGSATVADEHLATAVTQQVLARLFGIGLRVAPRSRERVMLATAQGEHHELGLRMAADVLEGAGFDVLSLGADVPPAALADGCRVHRPAVLGLSATMPMSLPSLVASLEAVASLPDPPSIMVAGQAAGAAVERGLEVALVERSDEVIAVVERLLRSPPRRLSIPPALLSLGSSDAPAEHVPDLLVATTGRMAKATEAAAGTARDAARRAYAMEQLAYRDPLTGLWNRRAYDDHLHDHVSAGDAVTVMMIDVDAFKEVNDRLGHEAGDEVLVTIGRAMLESVRPGDVVARFGGDEFCILLLDASEAEADVVAERLRARVESELREHEVTVSIGVAPPTGDRRSMALHADQALYDAKRAGRNRVVVAPREP